MMLYWGCTGLYTVSIRRGLSLFLFQLLFDKLCCKNMISLCFETEIKAFIHLVDFVLR